MQIYKKNIKKVDRNKLNKIKNSCNIFFNVTLCFYAAKKKYIVIEMNNQSLG